MELRLFFDSWKAARAREMHAQGYLGKDILAEI